MHASTKFLAAAVALLVASGCASASVGESAPTPAPDLIGCWLGGGFQSVPGRQATWLMQLRADGNFDVEFHIPGRPVQHEAGRWSLDGASLTAITLSVDGKAVDVDDPHFTDIYEIQRSDADSMSYLDRSSNITFTSTRAPCPGEA